MSDATAPSTPPQPPPAQGSYSTAVVHGGLGYSAGMTPRRDGMLVVTGTVGRDVTPSVARHAAGIAARNAYAAVARAAGADRIEGWLTMTVYIAAVPGFTEHTEVADGATEALDALISSAQRGARTAVGVASLPSGAPVEVAVTFALRPATDRQG